MGSLIFTRLTLGTLALLRHKDIIKFHTSLGLSNLSFFFGASFVSSLSSPPHSFPLLQYFIFIHFSGWRHHSIFAYLGTRPFSFCISQVSSVSLVSNLSGNLRPLSGMGTSFFGTLPPLSASLEICTWLSLHALFLFLWEAHFYCSDISWENSFPSQTRHSLRSIGQLLHFLITTMLEHFSLSGHSFISLLHGMPGHALCSWNKFEHRSWELSHIDRHII